MTPKPTPIKKEEDVQRNPDPHIDQDFPGFPHLPADKKSITRNPKQKRNRLALPGNGLIKPMELNSIYL